MDTATLLISTAAKIGFVLVIIFTFAPVLVWAERRQSAMIQDRVGPHRAGFRLFGRKIELAGLLHPLADALKMIWKEDFVPAKADRLLHSLAPVITLVTAIGTFAVIPFADTLYLEYLWNALPVHGSVTGVAIPMQVAKLNVGILFVFALAGTGVVGAAIAGYASDNKYSLLGGLRAAGQMVSYEVALGLTLVGCFMIYDTLRLEDMVLWQHRHVWGIFIQPVAFLLYFTAAIAETKRIPFDVPEGESELVGGYFTEYSGMKFGMFFMGEFIEVVVLSALATTIFFGGWDLPLLDRSGLEFFGYALDFSVGGYAVYWDGSLPHIVVIALQTLTFIVKVSLLIWFQLMIRWSLPRFRYDQIMALCWKYILPLALLNVVATGVVLLLIER
ncbi:MAG: complex I subunit 1 family protein [Myxococcota bacterium]